MSFSREVVKLHIGGRITIPKKWRKELGLNEGDHVLLQLYKGKIVVESLDSRLK